MSRFESFIDGLTSPVARDDGGETVHDRRSQEYRRRRKRFNSPDRAEKKGDDINRRAQRNNDIRSAANETGAVVKPYDPSFLRDISANAIVQAYFDTLSQDVGSTNWSIKGRDEEANVSDNRLAEAERRYEQLFPEQTAGDAHEGTTRILLELGDATWVKHFDESGRNMREVVPVDSATFFKRVDRFGITEGYVQVPRKNPSAANAVSFNKREIAWFEWSNRPDRHYGQGPLEKAQNEVELLEELAEKERLDLIQGSPPGVLSPDAQDEFGGLPNTDDWDNFVEDFRLNDGERHRVGYSRIPVDFTQLVPNYQELQVLDRSKFWVTVLGAVMKVNPSYAGFDFENVNRATDESQQEAYAQRGFRVTLRQLEESINRNIIWPEFGSDLKFEFEREQTISEKKTRAELVQTQATAGKEMANAGLNVSFRDGMLEVDDGVLEEGNVGGGGGDGGGFFASVDDPKQADLSVSDVRKAHDGDGVRLTGPSERPAYDSLVDWHDFLTAVVESGGRIIDTSGVENAVFPPQAPGAVNARMVVYGLDEASVMHLLDRYPIDLEIDTDRESKSERRPLTKAECETIDRVLLHAHKTQVSPDSVDDIEKAAWSGDQSVPEYVFEAIKDAIADGAVFRDFDSIPGDVVDTVEGLLEDNLTQPQGWSLDSIVDDMSKTFPGVEDGDLEAVARTEVTSVLSTAREKGYERRGNADEGDVFYWEGADDSRITDACKELLELTNPRHGGTPRPIDELVALEEEVHNKHFPDLSFRRHVIHPNERKTFVRDVSASTDVDIDVDVPSAAEFNEAAAGA